eukprot:1993557-Rhodomonas_salina.1
MEIAGTGLEHSRISYGGSGHGPHWYHRAQLSTGAAVLNSVLSHWYHRTHLSTGTTLPKLSTGAAIPNSAPGTPYPNPHRVIGDRVWGDRASGDRA